MTKQSLLDDRSRTGFAIGDRVNVLGKSDNKLYSGIIYDVLESQVELRWDDGIKVTDFIHSMCQNL